MLDKATINSLKNIRPDFSLEENIDTYICKFNIELCAYGTNKNEATKTLTRSTKLLQSIEEDTDMGSRIHQLLLGSADTLKGHFQEAWEEELEVSFSEEQWERIRSLTIFLCSCSCVSHSLP